MNYEWRGAPLEGMAYGEDSLHVPNGMQTLFPWANSVVDSLSGFERLPYRRSNVPRDVLTFVKGKSKDGIWESVPVYTYPGFSYSQVAKFKDIEGNNTLRKMAKYFNLFLKFEGQKIRKINHALATRYQSGSDHIGEHHDKVATYKKGAPTISVSFGATRPFLLRKGEELIRISLKDGDIFILGWKDNETYTHSVPKMTGEVGERVSLIFRAIQVEYGVQKKVMAALRGKEWRAKKKQEKANAESIGNEAGDDSTGNEAGDVLLE